MGSRPYRVLAATWLWVEKVVGCMSRAPGTDIKMKKARPRLGSRALVSLLQKRGFRIDLGLGRRSGRHSLRLLRCRRLVHRQGVAMLGKVVDLLFTADNVEGHECFALGLRGLVELQESVNLLEMLSEDS